MKKGVWKGGIRMHAHKKTIEPYHWAEGGIYSEKGKSIFTIKRREGRSTGICGRLAMKRIHQAIKVPSDFASPFCG